MIRLEANHNPMVEQSIEEFDVREALGSGSQGDVYSAYDRLLGRRVALKVFKPTDQDTDRSRALREARSLARLQHPNIVTLFGITRQGGSHVLIMEYSEGTPLSQKIAQAPLPIEDIEGILRQIASALQYAAERGLVHGDIKPSNIIVSADGTAKLLDFGLATMTEKDRAFATLEPGETGKSAFEGTIAYTAPEKVMGHSSSVQSDIFSLGAVLYEMITGTPAFRGPHQMATLHNILNEHPAPLITHRAGIGRWCQPLVDAMLEKDPKRRLATMLQVLNLLPVSTPTTSSAVVLARPKSLWSMTPRAGAIRQFCAVGVLLLGTLALTGSSGIGIGQHYAAPVSVELNHGIERLLNFHEDGAIADAQDIFGRIVENNPVHPAGNAGLALALIRQYTSQEADPATLRRATALAEQSLTSDPQLALANIAAAWAAEFNENFGRAGHLYDVADGLDPGNAFVLEGRARIFSNQQKFEQAELILRKALVLHPKSRVFFDELGTILSAQGKHVEAERVLRKGLELYPDNVRGYASLSHVLYMQERSREAIQVAQLGLQIRPDASLYNNLGTYLFFNGLYEQAALAFERTVELDGNSHQFIYWANLADAYRWLPGKQEESKSAYRQALRLLMLRQAARPGHSGINTRIAIYAAKAADLKLAQFSLNRLDEGKLTAPGDLYRIAVLHEILGNRRKALDALVRAVDAGYSKTEIANDPEFINLRQDRAYQNIVNYFSQKDGVK